MTLDRLRTALAATVVTTLASAGGTASTRTADSGSRSSRTTVGTARVVEQRSPVPVVEGVVCPSGELSETAGGFLARRPDGLPTRAAAVEAWLRTSPWRGHAYRIVDGRPAWVLRPDGTAVARLTFVRHSGFTVQGVLACPDQHAG